VVQIGVLSILARLLSARDFGLVGLATVFVGFATLVANFGMRESIVRRTTLTEREIRAGFTLAMLLGVGATLLLAATAPFAGALFESRPVVALILALSLTVLLTNTGLVADALLQRDMAWRRLMWVDISSYLIGYAATGTILAAVGFGPWSLVGSALGQAMLRTLLLVRARPHPKRLLLSGSEFAELLRFGWRFTAARMSNYSAQQADNVVIGRLLGAVPLGFYSRAWKLMTTPIQYLGTIVTRVLFPAMSRVRHETQQLRTAYLTGCAALAMVSAPLSVLMVVSGPEIVRVVLGPNWEATILPLQILTLGLMPRNVSLMSYCLDGVMGAMSRRAVRDGIFLLAVITGSLAGAPYGLPGVAAGVLVATLVHHALAIMMSKELVGHSWSEYIQSQAPGLVLGVAGVAVAVPLRLALQALGLPSAVLLVLTVGLTTTWLALLLLLRPTIVGRYGRIALSNLSAAMSGQPADGVRVPEGFRRELASRWGGADNP
jgi:PST family polysaccharide transporter